MPDTVNEKFLSELWQEGRERDAKLNDTDSLIDSAVHDRAPTQKPILEGAAANFQPLSSRELYTYLQLVMGQFKEKPRFVVNEISASNRSIQRADSDQRFLNTIIWEIERQQSDAVHRKVVGDLFRYGRAMFKVHSAMQLQGAGGPLDPSDDSEVLRWKHDYDDKRAYLPIPIAVRHVQPPTAHVWEDAGVGPAQALEIRLRQVRDLVNTYPEHQTKLSKFRLSDYLWWFEHQNRTTCTYGYIPSASKARQGTTPPIHPNIQILRQFDHNYGRVSYVFIPGDESGLDEPSERWVSLLWPMIELIKQRDLLLSQIATHVRATAWFYPLMELAEGSTFAVDEETGRPKSIDMEPFIWTVLLPGEKATAFQPPQLSPDAYRLVERVDQLIQSHGLLPVLQGNVADYTAGYPLNQRMHAARARYNVISEHLREGWAQLGHLLMKMVEVLDVPVAVIAPKDSREAKGAGSIIDMTPKRASQPRLIDAEWPLALPTDLALMTRIAREAASPIAPGKEPLMSIMQARQKFLDDNEPELTSKMIEREEFRSAVKVSAIQQVSQKLSERIATEFPELAPTSTANPAPATPGQVPGTPMAPGSGMPTTPLPPTGPAPGQFGGQSTNAPPGPGTIPGVL